MKYLALFTPHDLALLHDWLTETGELYVDIYLPHSGGSSAAYFVHAFDELKALVAQQTWPEIVITVFRRHQYPLRGIADEHLLNRALAQIPDGEWYSIVSLDEQFPANCSIRGSGNSHAELRRDFAEIIGERVGIGQAPFDVYDDQWLRAHPDEVFVLSVTKTRSYYESYAQNPDQYRWLEALWQA